MVALQSRSHSIPVIHGLLMVQGMNHALAALEALNMIGSCVVNLSPFPIYFWLYSGKPGVSQDCFMFS